MSARPCPACGEPLPPGRRRTDRDARCADCVRRALAVRRKHSRDRCARGERRWLVTHPDFTVLAATELRLAYHTAGPDGRRQITERAHALKAAATSAGTYVDPNARTIARRRSA